MQGTLTRFIALIWLSLMLVLPEPGAAQFNPDILELKPFTSVEKVPAGSTFKLAVEVDIHSPFHINSNQPLDPAFIPTTLEYEPIEGISFGKPIFPEAEFKRFPFSEEKLAIYEGTVTIFTEVTVRENFPSGTVILKGRLHYQACNDENCFMPQTESFEIPVEVVSADAEAIPINSERFAAMAFAGGAQSSSTAVYQLTSEEVRAKEIIERGLFYAIAAFFIFGLALNLTPCVYPVIPITVSYFGSQADRQKGQALLRASVYVLGIAVVFALLGLISGLAGKQWGFLFQNPWFVIVITVLILAMAASMFGAFEIRVPMALMNRFGQAREGVLGALIMGLTVGVVIAPCAAGIIIGLVGLVAKLGIVVKGTLLFFIMGLGLGLPYLILATFSGLLNRLPQSGMWMIWIKKFFGVLLVGVALYFFLPQARHIENMQGFFFGLLAIFGGLLLGFLDHAPGYTRGFKFTKGVFGLLLIVLGVLWTSSAIHYQPPRIAWHNYNSQNMQELLKDGKPVFIDFYADWCAPCKELDRKTFPDPRVIEQAEKFTMVKVDCTAPDENVRAFMNRFQVTGMPTLVFLTSRGEEVKELREIGFINADELLKRMNATLQRSNSDLP